MIANGWEAEVHGEGREISAGRRLGWSRRVCTACPQARGKIRAQVRMIRNTDYSNTAFLRFEICQADKSSIGAARSRHPQKVQRKEGLHSAVLFRGSVVRADAFLPSGQERSIADRTNNKAVTRGKTAKPAPDVGFSG